MDTLTCDIELDAQTVTAIYRGSVRFVQARARDGREVRFPALALQPFVTREGVHGTFALEIDARQLRRISRCP